MRLTVCMATFSLKCPEIELQSAWQLLPDLPGRNPVIVHQNLYSSIYSYSQPSFTTPATTTAIHCPLATSAKITSAHFLLLQLLLLPLIPTTTPPAMFKYYYDTTSTHSCPLFRPPTPTSGNITTTSALVTILTIKYMFVGVPLNHTYCERDCTRQSVQ